MDTAIAILERVEKNKSISDGSGVNNRWYPLILHPLVGIDQTRHQTGDVFGFWSNKVDFFLLPGYRFPNIILAGAVIGIAEPGIDYAVLNFNQAVLLAEVILPSHLQYPYEALGPGGGRLDMFDFEG